MLEAAQAATLLPQGLRAERSEFAAPGEGQPQSKRGEGWIFFRRLNYGNARGSPVILARGGGANRLGGGAQGTLG